MLGLRFCDVRLRAYQVGVAFGVECRFALFMLVSVAVACWLLQAFGQERSCHTTHVLPYLSYLGDFFQSQLSSVPTH